MKLINFIITWAVFFLLIMGVIYIFSPKENHKSEIEEFFKGGIKPYISQIWCGKEDCK